VKVVSLAILEIRKFGDPVLRKASRPVPRVNNAVRKILDDMLETMRNASGAGLAAPQVGISKRIVIVDIGEGPLFLVNPEIVSVSEETQIGVEGCLSFPGYIGEVERPLKITVKALDRDGHDVWVDAEGYLARACCHEIDHLDGVLYTDRATTISEVKKEPDEPEGEEAKEREITAVFMGSPEFAVPSLDELVTSGVKVELVVTQPDRPFGRKQEIRPTPVKARAMELGIPVLTCERVGDPGVVRKIREIAPDFVIVAAFGQKLPEEVLSAPKIACLNVHPSLLPKYRGGNPVQRAIMNGDTATGVSIMYMSEKVDAGDIVLRREVPIGPNETFGTLERRLASLGAHVLVEAVRLLASGSVARIPQDEPEATIARHLSKGEEVIDWRRPAAEVHNLVRGLSPKPGAVTYLDGQRIKIWRTRLPLELHEGSHTAGSIIGVEGESALVQCGDVPIAVLEVQPEGRSSMSAQAFLMGLRSRNRVFGGRVET
jgi:methionyl-tRNA formyltransferase